MNIQITLTADPALLAAVTALASNLETVALAIDSSLRIREHAARQVAAPMAELAPIDAVIPAPVNAMPEQTVLPFHAPVAPPPAIPVTAAPIAPAPTYSFDQLAVAGAQLMDAGKQPELIALLGRFGSPSIMNLPKERLGEFAMELRALGARI